MRAERALRVCMQALVLLDLLFVQLTEAAGLHWLGPLFVLALAAPLLERFREQRLYRALWNAGVVGFFLLLVHHAQRAQLGNVLEDGLVLAVLCQVHLLNNLRPDQRPDLYFFNAFLVAIMAGYLTEGLGFPIVFLAFVPAFVIGLELRCAAEGGRVIARPALRRLVLDGGRRAATLLAASLVVFFFWPRDFERKAYFHERLSLFEGDGSGAEVGFSEELRLDHRRDVATSDAPALRVTLLDGRPEDVPSLWRGATLGQVRGTNWNSLDVRGRRAAVAADERWRREGDSLTRFDEPSARAPRVAVTRVDPRTDRLFVPLEACELALAHDQSGTLRAGFDGAIESARPGELRYELTIGDARRAKLGGAVPSELRPELEPYVHLPSDPRTRATRELAGRLAARLPAGAEQKDLVALFANHLSRNCTYLPPGSEGAASTLDAFTSGEAGGHCEYFASALAIMLRSRGVPCRVATGYRSTRWDSGKRVLSFATSDAHAWVEVLDPSAGWIAVDPSPMSVGGGAGLGLWATLRAGWAAVTGFDSGERAAALAWLGALPRRVFGAWSEHAIAVACSAAALLLVALALVRKRVARGAPAVRAYLRAVRRARLEPLAGETPRELLERARSVELPRERFAALERATAQHEAARYADSVPAARQCA